MAQIFRKRSCEICSEQNGFGRTKENDYSNLIFPWDLTVAMEITFGIKDSNGKNWFSERRFAKVMKNNFWGLDENGITFGKPYLFNVSFNGVVEELMKPWHGTEGVPIKTALDTCVEEAKKKFDIVVKKP